MGAKSTETTGTSTKERASRPPGRQRIGWARRDGAWLICIACASLLVLAGALPGEAATSSGTAPPDAVAAASPPPAPIISGITPGSGVPGTNATVSGNYFETGGTASDYVSFGGTQASIVSWANTSIICTVPGGLSGTVQVTVSTVYGLSNTWSFTVTAPASPPAISSLTPTSGPPGADVTIGGSGFGAGGTGSDYVTFGGFAAAVKSWSDTQVVCTVPFDLSGAVPVTVSNGVGTSNAGTFTVTTPPVSNPSTFYFAEGYTGIGFQEYLCLGNPGDLAVQATVTYLFTDGTNNSERVAVPANSRSTLDINAKVGTGREVSLKVDSPSSIVAERPMYFSYLGTWTGGHDAVGAASTSPVWYFAEGYTGPGFDEFICVLNPGDREAALTFRFQTQEEGEKVVAGMTVPASSRRSYKVNDLLPGRAYQASLKLEASAPVVAERSMYFDYTGWGNRHWTGGHDVLGATSLANEYYFAEGTTRSGFEEWLTLQNPGDSPIVVTAAYQLGAGQGDPITRPYTVEARSRRTLFVPQEIGADKDVSIHLASGSGFLAERPMYFRYSYQGADWSGGHCVIGATQPAGDWFFAEGYTGNGFNQWLCIQNPTETDAKVQVTYYVQGGGALPVRTVDVPADSRVTIFGNESCGAGLAFSTRIRMTSGAGVICERPMYFDYAGWDGGHDVVGYRP